MKQEIFSSELELGKFIGDIDVIRDAFQAISKTNSTYQLHMSPSGIKILAFHSLSESDYYTLPFRIGEFDLVSSENHQVLDFISTKVNPKFSINNVAVELFKTHLDRLSELLNKVIDSPLVITGQGLGGNLAILFALLHHHEVDVKESNGSKTPKRPICITFGSPLLGDKHLQGAISERPQWKSCFLNVVAKTDPVASFFTSNTPYKPFGTFLFCTESGGHSAFDDEKAILAILDAMVSPNSGNSHMHDYRIELGSIRENALYRGAMESNETNLSPLRAGNVLQFREIRVLNDISMDLMVEIEKKQVKMVRSKNRYEPARKLNDMKIILTYMEWYMKGRRPTGGYYDTFKNAETISEAEIISKSEAMRHQRKLNQYWKKIVEENDLMPQKEGANLRKRWLYAGNNYRRIIEPLDIAEHCKKGKTNYIAVRPNHYKLLEKWSGKDKKELEQLKRKTKAASLTEDSCFWARVEEALISIRELNNGDQTSIANNLKQFEDDVWDAINDCSLSPDVFVEGSSLRKWWSQYKTYKGSSYDSELAKYMNDGKYTLYCMNNTLYIY